MSASTTVSSQRLSTTTVMAIAAVAAALIVIFGEKSPLGAVTVVGALLGLVPWALEVGEVRLRPAVSLVMMMAPVVMIVVVDRNAGGMFPATIAVVWHTRAHAHAAVAWLAVGISVSAIVTLTVLQGTADETGMIYFVGGVGVAWLAGLMIRRQEVLVAELQAAQAQRAEHAAANERTRIAREVHDVVAHSLTVTMLHVAGARRALSHDPTRAADALERAESVGRESLDSIRQVVGLLRTGDDDSGHQAPLPAITDIPALVDQYRGVGLRVSDELRLDGVVADATTSLTAFRVVQEALANALQHAPGAPVMLQVSGDTEGATLRIVAENPTTATAVRSDRVGLGLRGMCERVRAAGGSVEVGATSQRTFRVDATLPLRPAVVR
jgi:signal transduction histidine kinase